MQTIQNKKTSVAVVKTGGASGLMVLLLSGSVLAAVAKPAENKTKSPGAKPASLNKKPVGRASSPADKQTPAVWIIEVQGHRDLPADNLGQAATQTVLRRQWITPARQTLADVLGQIPGLQVRTLGGPGAFGTVSLRGSTAEQVGIYVDGFPLNQALGGGVNVGAISLEGVARVEVYKSHIPPRFHDAPVGGVINLVTQGAAPAKNHTSVRGRLGSHGLGALSLEHAQKSPAGRLWALYSEEAYKGDFDYHDDFGTPFNPADDARRTRLNNSHRDRQLLLTKSWSLKNSRTLETRLSLGGRAEGVPGFGVAQSTRSSLNTGLSRLVLSLRQPTGKQGAGLRETILTLGQHVSRFKDPDARLGTGGPQNNHNRTGLWQLESSWSGLAMGRHTQAQWHAALSQESYSPKDDAQPLLLVGRHSRRSTLALSGQVDRTFGQGRLSLSLLPRLGWVRSRLGGDFSSPLFSKNDNQQLAALDAALNWRLRPHTEARATLGRGFRQPSFYELFGDRGSVIGNTALTHEKSWRAELGLRRRFLRGHAEAVWFWQGASDLIVFEQAGQFVSRPVNLDKTRGQGGEFTLAFAPGRRTDALLGYSLLSARNHSADPAFRGNHLPGVAAESFSWRLSHAPARHWRVVWEGERRGRLFQDTANLTFTPSQQQHHLSLRHEGGRTNWWVAVRNAGDNTNADVNGFPLPGRQWWWGWAWSR